MDIDMIKASLDRLLAVGKITQEEYDAAIAKLEEDVKVAK